MDRMAVLLNLKDVRDLEVAKICMMRNRNEYWCYFQQDIDNLSVVYYVEIQKEEDEGRLYLISIAGLLIGVIITLVSLAHMGDGGTGPLIIRIIVSIFRSPVLALLGVIVGIPIVYYSFGFLSEAIAAAERLEKTKAFNESARKHNAEEKARLEANKPQITQLKQSQREYDDFWREELEKVENLLDELYSVNLVTEIYRHNLAAIQYIYEYMSTSQASLEHTLLSTQIEDGIRRIEKKLDVIIQRQEETIFMLHRQEAQNESMMEQNNQMLESLRRIEENIFEASRYAQISAYYNKTCAFFALADYLEKKE